MSATAMPAELLYGRLLAAAAEHLAAGVPPVRGAVRRFGGEVRPLPLERWLGPADDADAAVLARVEGSALDIGCGPGRHVAALRAAGRRALGLDLSPTAVSITRGRGADAVLGSVFDVVPDAGGWATALLLDGNVGIGGDPVLLLRRVRELLGRGGLIIAELEPPGAPTERLRVRLEWGDAVSDWFPWGVVGVDDVRAVARAAGLRREWTSSAAGRWFAALRCP